MIFARFFKNKVGNILGYGMCSECGDSFYWQKDIVNVRWHVSAGMFPICRRCFDKLSAKAIVEHCQNLWMKWHRETPDNPHYVPEKFPVIVIAESVRLEKSGQSQWINHKYLPTYGSVDGL